MADDYLDRQEYVQSQYGNSPTIKKLLNDFRDKILPGVDIDVVYKNIIDIETASGVGLDVWGRIVGIERNIYIDDSYVDYPVFGFRGGGENAHPFNQGVFFDPEQVISGERVLVTLEDDYYRRLILYKALANISSADMATLNRLAAKLYEDEDLLCTNIVDEGTLPNGDKYNTSPMYVRFVWRKNDISNLQRQLFETGILFSLAAGVKYDVKVISKDPLFGFAGSGLNPFGNGAFVRVLQIDNTEATEELTERT